MVRTFTVLIVLTVLTAPTLASQSEDLATRAKDYGEDHGVGVLVEAEGPQTSSGPTTKRLTDAFVEHFRSLDLAAEGFAGSGQGAVKKTTFYVGKKRFGPLSPDKVAETLPTVLQAAIAEKRRRLEEKMEALQAEKEKHMAKLVEHDPENEKLLREREQIRQELAEAEEKKAKLEVCEMLIEQKLSFLEQAIESVLTVLDWERSEDQHPIRRYLHHRAEDVGDERAQNEGELLIAASLFYLSERLIARAQNPGHELAARGVTAKIEHYERTTQHRVNRASAYEVGVALRQGLEAWLEEPCVTPSQATESEVAEGMRTLTTTLAEMRRLLETRPARRLPETTNPPERAKRQRQQPQEQKAQAIGQEQRGAGTSRVSSPKATGEEDDLFALCAYLMGVIESYSDNKFLRDTAAIFGQRFAREARTRHQTAMHEELVGILETDEQQDFCLRCWMHYGYPEDNATKACTTAEPAFWAAMR